MKLSFKAWLSKKEKTSIKWSENFIKELAKASFHDGDCTNQNYSCSLCTLEELLKDYYEYFTKNKTK